MFDDFFYNFDGNLIIILEVIKAKY